jgi:hypothetical protein
LLILWSLVFVLGWFLFLFCFVDGSNTSTGFIREKPCRSLVFESSIYSSYESLVKRIAGKDFLPFCRLSLRSSDCFLYCAEAF